MVHSCAVALHVCCAHNGTFVVLIILEVWLVIVHMHSLFVVKALWVPRLCLLALTLALPAIFTGGLD